MVITRPLANGSQKLLLRVIIKENGDRNRYGMMRCGLFACRREETSQSKARSGKPSCQAIWRFKLLCVNILWCWLSKKGFWERLSKSSSTTMSLVRKMFLIEWTFFPLRAFEKDLSTTAAGPWNYNYEITSECYRNCRVTHFESFQGCSDAPVTISYFPFQLFRFTLTLLQGKKKYTPKSQLRPFLLGNGLSNTKGKYKRKHSKRKQASQSWKIFNCFS